MKRKANYTEATEEGGSSKRKTTKKPRTNNKDKGKEKVDAAWPEYFHDLFKVFKALNTVLAFISSRKHLATTFPVVRSSVENLLKRPLDLAKVAELKALLPDLIKFAYIPRNEHRIYATQIPNQRASSPDYSLPSTSHSFDEFESAERVLILEFAENSTGKKGGSNLGLSLPASLTPTAMKKLVEKRNERFTEAADELIRAAAAEDPIVLLQAASNDHIPVNPSAKSKVSPPKAIIEPKDRPSIDAVISEIEEQEWFKGQIIARRTFEAGEAKHGTLDSPLSATIQQALKNSREITSLYHHQTAAINALSKAKNIIVSTSTASGKSVIYQVPLLRFLEDDIDSTAVFIYPTKALAQDQKTALEELLWSCPGLDHIKVATYDGDTPQEERPGIRETASVIFTNFDMLHASILPHEELWRRFLQNIKLVAVDELHYYSDLFGSHVAQVIRRFRRVCAAVGNRRMRFVSCSATISNPSHHMSNLFALEDIEEVTEDGAPSGRKDFLIWNSPLVDPKVPKLGRRSAMSEATGLMRFLMGRGVRVILFCKIRKVCELAMKALRTDLSAEGRLDILEKVMPYRGGYSQQDRRRIEREAFSGNLLGIVATNALELGVDIGVLDAVIVLGFPYKVASLRQQVGRAGRRARDSLAVLVADGLPIDQHYVDNPDDLFDKPIDDLLVDVESKVILESHLQCAAQEMPLSIQDEVYFGPLMQEVCDNKLVKKDGWYHTHPKFLPFPAKHVSIRGTEEEKYTVVDVTGSRREPRIIEEVEVSRALFEVYEGGVFMHQGLTFVVNEISHDSKIARVIRADVNWITSPRDYTDVDAVQTYRIREIVHSPHRAFYGRVESKTVVYGFYKIRNKKILDTVDVDTPPWERQATGLWMDVPKGILQLMKSKGIEAAGAIHSAQHAILNRFALAADLKTECKAPESQRKRPGRLIFYDASGSGVSSKAFDHVSDLLRQANDAIQACQCEQGCEKCIHSSSCREGNVVESKLGAQLILRNLLNLNINEESFPSQTSEPIPDTFNATIVEAGYVRPVDGVQIEAA